MEFRHVECFVTTYEHNSISEAAGKLLVSQQALSRTIAGLEKELGCQLFERTSKGITPTREGRYLYQQMAPVVGDFRRASQRALRHARRSHHEIDLAYSPQAFRVLGMNPFFAFRDAYPDCRVVRHEMSDRDVLSHVRADYRRLGLLALPEDRMAEGLERWLVREWPLVLYAHETSPLARRERVGFADLANERFLMLEEGSLYHDLVDAHACEAGFEPIKTVVSSDASQVYKLVDSGAGVFLGIGNPQVQVLYPHVKFVPMLEDLRFRVFLVCQCFGKLGAPERALTEHITSAC